MDYPKETFWYSQIPVSDDEKEYFLDPDKLSGASSDDNLNERLRVLRNRHRRNMEISVAIQAEEYANLLREFSDRVDRSLLPNDRKVFQVLQGVEFLERHADEIENAIAYMNTVLNTGIVEPKQMEDNELHEENTNTEYERALEGILATEINKLRERHEKYLESLTEDYLKEVTAIRKQLKPKTIAPSQPGPSETVREPAARPVAPPSAGSLTANRPPPNIISPRDPRLIYRQQLEQQCQQPRPNSSLSTSTMASKNTSGPNASKQPKPLQQQPYSAKR